MTDRFPPSHAEHDLLLIAAFAAGDLGAAEREAAERLASTCSECGLLEADLRVIATATAALPKPVRQRDFSLSSEDAARLRRRGWRGLVGTLAGPRSAGLKPLATGLTTLGIAGLLLAALSPIQLGGAAAGPSSAAAPATSEADTNPDTNYVFPAPAPSTAPGRQGAFSAASTPPRAAQPVSRPSTLNVDTAGRDEGPVVSDQAPSGLPAIASPGGSAPSPLAVLSGAFLVLGLFLFGIRWTARRLSDA